MNDKDLTAMLKQRYGEFEFNSIKLLHEMLEKEEIEHDFFEDFGGYHIYVYDEFDKSIISVIENYSSYGHGEDLLEIMGLLTPEEREIDSVAGFLTAEDVFNRIKKAVK